MAHKGVTEKKFGGGWKLFLIWILQDIYTYQNIKLLFYFQKLQGDLDLPSANTALNWRYTYAYDLNVIMILFYYETRSISSLIILYCNTCLVYANILTYTLLRSQLNISIYIIITTVTTVGCCMLAYFGGRDVIPIH